MAFFSQGLPPLTAHLQQKVQMQNCISLFSVQAYRADGAAIIHADVWEKDTCIVKSTPGLQSTQNQ